MLCYKTSSLRINLKQAFTPDNFTQNKLQVVPQCQWFQTSCYLSFFDIDFLNLIFVNSALLPCKNSTVAHHRSTMFKDI